MVRFITDIPAVSGLALDNSVEDEVTASWTDTQNYGHYRVQYRETGSGDSYNAAPNLRQVVDAADSTAEWSGGSNAVVGTTSSPSEDGTSVQGSTSDPNTLGNRFVDFTPGTNDDLSGKDSITFWYETDSLDGAHSFRIRDGASNVHSVSFKSLLSTNEGELVQLGLQQYADNGVDLTDVDRYRWIFDAATAGVDKTIYVDSVVAHEDTLVQSDTDTTLYYLEDGEQYDVRLRGETEHATTAWSELSAVTVLPAPTGASVANVTGKSADFSWTENADNEDSVLSELERLFGSGWEVVESTSLPENTESDSTSGLRPGETYRFRATAKTEHSSSPSAYSSEFTATATGDPTTSVPAEGWYAEVDHPSGRTVVPEIGSSAQLSPRLNALPTAELPVPADERWLGSGFERADMRVWRNGVRQPIDTLENVRVGESQYTLVASGGRELRDRTQVSVVSDDAHLVAESIINETSYTADVDDPATESQSNTLVQEADTQSELTDNLASVIGAQDPLEVTASGVRPLPISRFEEGESGNLQNGAASEPDSSYSGGSGVRVEDNGEYAEWTFTFDHEIPAENVALAFRDEAPSDDTCGFKWEIITSVGTYTWTSVGATAADINLSWEGQNGGAPYGGSGWGGGDLPAGTHTVRLTCTDGGGASEYYVADCVAMFDSRYSPGFDDSVDSNGYLSSPVPFRPIVVEFADANTARAVTGGRSETVVNDESSSFELALSQDSGATYPITSGTSTVDGDFGSNSTSLRLKATLGGYGSRTSASPTQDYLAQTLQEYDLFADLEDTPVLDNKAYDGQRKDILTSVAEYGDFIWEYTVDQQGNGTVTFTSPGQRTSDPSSDLLSFDVTKNVSESYRKAVIYGSTRRARGEQFTSSHGSAVSLDNDSLAESKESVYDPSTGAQFENGPDYTMDYQNGEITVLASGAMSDATTYEIDYSHRTRGEYESGSFDAATDQTLVRTIPGLSSDQACTQAALYLVQDLSEPYYEATVSVSRRADNTSLVDDIALDGLPDSVGRMEVREVKEGPGTVTLRLGSRRTAEEAVASIRQRVSDVAEKT